MKTAKKYAVMTVGILGLSILMTKPDSKKVEDVPTYHFTINIISSDDTAANEWEEFLMSDVPIMIPDFDND